MRRHASSKQVPRHCRGAFSDWYGRCSSWVEGVEHRTAPRKGGDRTMLNWALTFFVIALIAAVLGFSGVAGMSANIGWLLAVLGVIVLVVGLIGSNIGRPTLP